MTAGLPTAFHGTTPASTSAALQDRALGAAAATAPPNIRDLIRAISGRANQCKNSLQSTLLTLNSGYDGIEPDPEPPAQDNLMEDLQALLQTVEACHEKASAVWREVSGA